MSTMWFIIIIFALLAVIPVLIAYTILNTRDLDLKRAMEALELRFKGVDQLEQRTLDLREQISKVRVSVDGLDESFRNLNGKMNYRIKAEGERERKRREKEQEPDDDQVPVEQQELPFPVPPYPPHPGGNGLPISPTPPKRRFGEIL